MKKVIEMELLGIQVNRIYLQKIVKMKVNVIFKNSRTTHQNSKNISHLKTSGKFKQDPSETSPEIHEIFSVLVNAGLVYFWLIHEYKLSPFHSKSEKRCKGSAVWLYDFGKTQSAYNYV